MHHCGRLASLFPDRSVCAVGMVGLEVRTSDYLQNLYQVIYYLPLRFEWRINCNKWSSFFHCSIRGVWGCVWIALGSEKYSRSNYKFGLGLRRGIMRNNRSTYFLLCSLSRTISRLLCSHCLYRIRLCIYL